MRLNCAGATWNQTNHTHADTHMLALTSPRSLVVELAAAREAVEAENKQLVKEHKQRMRERARTVAILRGSRSKVYYTTYDMIQGEYGRGGSCVGVRFMQIGQYHKFCCRYRCRRAYACTCCMPHGVCSLWHAALIIMLRVLGVAQ
jgi:hypothetical protein